MLSPPVLFEVVEPGHGHVDTGHPVGFVRGQTGMDVVPELPGQKVLHPHELPGIHSFFQARFPDDAVHEQGRKAPRTALGDRCRDDGAFVRISDGFFQQVDTLLMDAHGSAGVGIAVHPVTGGLWGHQHDPRKLFVRQAECLLDTAYPVPAVAIDDSWLSRTSHYQFSLYKVYEAEALSRIGAPLPYNKRECVITRSYQTHRKTFPFREKEVDKTAKPMKSFSAIPPSGRSDPHDPYPSVAEAVAVARTSGLTDSDSAFMGCLAA